MSEPSEELLEKVAKVTREIDYRLTTLSTTHSLFLLRRIRDWCQSRINASLPRDGGDRAKRDYRRRPQ